MAAKIDSMVGMVERGLFLKMANLALIAGENETVERSV
jgi:ribose 5-phosphate isomerase